MYKRICSFFVLTLLACWTASAQSKLTEAFKEQTDTLNTLIQQKTTVFSPLQVKKLQADKNHYINFYFSDALVDIPWTEDTYHWFRKTLKNLLPEPYANYHIGNIYGKKLNILDLISPELGDDGKPRETRWTANDPKGSCEPLVETVGAQQFDQGMSGRNIAIWQSHGKYYEADFKRWEWQRAPDWTTVEDTYTQSYVLPFLIPMLENAGAYVMTPRERDTQRNESVVDNDPCFGGERNGLLRRSGQYMEMGKWKDAGEGFADAKEIYTGMDNPFRMGTARMSKCVRREADAMATWTPDIPEDGKYAVYISYKTLKNSSRSAHYTVRHAAGETEFIVNQRMGGGTWIYLGTFDFEAGNESQITLDNGTPEGRKYVRGSVVTADGIRIGGGMGKIARGNEGDPLETYTLSGLPAYLEGAMYSMQWAGADSALFHKFEDDYTNDYGTRGPWVSMMSGGSAVNPDQEGKGIPFDLSFAFHSDAGTTPDDSIIGTLSIYTLLCEGKRTLPSGENRMTCRDLANLVQTQIVEDVRKQYNPDWSRRFLWDRSYSESRTPAVPAMLLELLSHQNFADMKYGLDPTFRFSVSRAIYKGMLKYLSCRYGCDYTVQPLPVNSFAVTLDEDNNAVLRWKASIDTLESTAVPSGYLLYTRTGDGVFDQGHVIRDLHQEGEVFSTTVRLPKGKISSFQIVAFNEGGRSFPSEILSAGIPDQAVSDKKVLVVNNFTRVSAPAWFDTPEYAGFLPDLDRGVSYGKEINYLGRQYQFRRDLPWVDDDNPGFGASYINETDSQYMGNSFDYPYLHGKAILAAGYPFCSASTRAFAEMEEVREGIWSADLICGKQVTTMVGCGKVAPRYEVFPVRLQDALADFTQDGGHVLLSGAHIATDAWQGIYPVQLDSAHQAETRNFIQNVLGYRWMSNYASKTATVKPIVCTAIDASALPSRFSFVSEPNETIYNVETPDGIVPANGQAHLFLRYTDSLIGAGVCFDGGRYKVVSLGFPIETLKTEADRFKMIRTALNYFNEPKENENEK